MSLAGEQCERGRWRWFFREPGGDLIAMSAVTGYDDLAAACNGWMQFYQLAEQGDRKHKLLEDDHRETNERAKRITAKLLESEEHVKLQRNVIGGLCVTVAVLVIALASVLLG